MIKELFRGKKVYILGAIAVGYGIVGFATGWISNDAAMGAIWTGLTAMGLRAGISNG